MHFAAHAYVGESVTNPKKYFHNNVEGGLSLLNAALDAGVKKIIFSSTCAVYGEPAKVPIEENTPRQPVNPYGVSKMFFEQALEAYDRAYGFRYASLRYFNAAGADESGEIGELHDPETHLIPLALAAAAGQASELRVFGSDYPTPDGTCIRDYIHVNDLASAHVKALEYLAAGNESVAVNVGTGTGASVQEVISSVEDVTGKKVPHTMVPRRPGDPPRLVANPAKAQSSIAVESDAWSARRGRDRLELDGATKSAIRAARGAIGIVMNGKRATRSERTMANDLAGKKVAFLGAGKMGGILLQALLKNGSLSPKFTRATVAHEERAKALSAKLNVKVGTKNVEAAKGADIIIIAVKPQVVEEVVREISGHITRKQLIVSVAASVPTSMIEKNLPPNVPVIRAMPNTPCQQGAGMTAICKGKHATVEDVSLACHMFDVVGRTVVVDEKHMDAVTALSASGPAYIYIILESLAEAGVKVGLPRDIATLLAAQTTLGAARVVLETGDHPALLKDAVTTPAGCTIDAIMELEEGKLRVTLIKAVVKAAQRAKELAFV